MIEAIKEIGEHFQEQGEEPFVENYQTANLSKLPAGLDLGYFRSQVQTDKGRRDGFYPTLVEL